MNDSSDHVGQGDNSLLFDPRISSARAFLEGVDSWVIDRQKEITSIPSPTYQEGERARRMAELFQEVGLSGLEVDEIGNVRGWLPPSGGEGSSTRRKTSGAASKLWFLGIATQMLP